MSKRKTTQEFVEQAKLIYGNEYDYSQSEYTIATEKIKILCLIHGEFEKIPRSHLSGQGCPKCSGIYKPTTEEFIQKAKLVHDDKYDYSLVTYNKSREKINIICRIHGKFEQTPVSHLSGTGCPKCNGGCKSNIHEFIEKAKLIHGDKYDYSDSDYINTRTKIKILCKKHNEIFEQTPSTHLDGSGCPKCSVDKTKSNKEDFIDNAKLIHGEKYDYSLVEYFNNTTKINIICPIHDNIFSITPNAHLSGVGCIYCSNYKMNTQIFSEKAKLIHGNLYDYSESQYTDSKTKLKIICPTHGEFWQIPNNHTSKQQGCPKCANNGISKLEMEVQKFIKSLGLKTEDNKSERIKPYQLDIFIPSHNLAIEFDGLHWHSELFHDKNFHLMKTQLCEKTGIKLIHIFEDEWVNKKEIVKSRLLNLLKLTPNKIFARKCIIKEVPSKESRKFLDENHIQGNLNSKVKLGLYHNDILVSLMTFGTLRKNLGGDSKEGYYELGRFSNLINTNVVGGASKLFKHFVNNYQPKQITSYADKRWSQGDLYEKLGFDFIHDSAPCYFYIINNNRKNRFLFRKDVLISEGFDGNKTEHEIMLDRGIFRIYDCGAKKYVINL